MSPEGIKSEYRYYICDFFFILMFLILQIMISRCIIRDKATDKISIVLNAVAIIRAIADFIENILLIIIIKSFPHISETLVVTSSYFTNIKLICNKIWIVVLLISLVYNFIFCKFKFIKGV